MKFGLTTYFDMVDVCEVLAHETSAAWFSRNRTGRFDIVIFRTGSESVIYSIRLGGLCFRASTR